MQINKQNKICFFCDNCFNTYFIDLNVKNHNLEYPYIFVSMYCTNCESEGNVFEVDENIIDSIALLNKKGYTTRYSCGGHEYEDDSAGYIQFESSMKNKEIFTTLPESWILEDLTNKKDIYKSYIIRQKDKLSKHFTNEQLLKVNNELYDWVVSLPNIRKG
jgi:hypothetical protein